MGGQPVFKAEPRMPIQTVVDNLDDGMTPEEISKAYKLDLALINGVKQFVESPSGWCAL